MGHQRTRPVFVLLAAGLWRSNLIDLAAGGTITRDDRRGKLAAMDDKRSSLQDRLDAISSADAERLRLKVVRSSVFTRIEDGFLAFTQEQQTPQEVHASYREMDLRVEADAEGEITLSGSFDLGEDGCDTGHRSCALSEKTTNCTLRFRITEDAPEVELELV